MELVINGKHAALLKNSSFEYVSENRAFSDADDYTLSITLPLAGCQTNLEIFGHVERMDVASRHIAMEASIITRNFSKNGVITVVEATNSDVKCQFLEGRSVQNFMTTFDDIYINELPLGSYPLSTLPQDVNHGDIDHGADCVALPWVNDSAEGFMNNEVVVVDGVYQWAESTKGIGKLSYMPYLISIAKRICKAVGYTCDFSEWENSDERFLLICNVLPASWDIPQFSRALPHWTVTDFFNELEKILICEIDVDHRLKHINLTFSNNIDNTKSVVKINDVLDSFTSEISYEDAMCQFKGIANIRYADRGDSKWGHEQCQWLIDLMKQENKYYKEFKTEAEYMAWYIDQFGPLGPGFTNKDEARGKNIGMLIHIAETDRYGMWRVVNSNLPEYPNMYLYQWLDLNRFGDIVNDPNSNNNIDLQCVPARLDSTDAEHGLCVFLAPSNFSENEDYDSDGVRQPMAYSNLLKGMPDSVAEYYDKIYLAYWDGHSMNQGEKSYSGNILPPCPYVDERFSLKKRYKSYLNGLIVNPKEKIKISFLSTHIPDVRSIFHIKGKMYLCEKITATFTENGISQLLKGDFYLLVDD